MLGEFMRQISIIILLKLQDSSVVGQRRAVLLNPWMIAGGGVQ
jgi:hypothetical protein